MSEEARFAASVKTITDKSNGNTEVQFVVKSDEYMEDLDVLRRIRKVPLIVTVGREQATFFPDRRPKQEKQLPLAEGPAPEPVIKNWCRDCGMGLTVEPHVGAPYRMDTIKGEEVMWTLNPTEEEPGLCSICGKRRSALVHFVYPPMITDEKGVLRCEACGLKPGELPKGCEKPEEVWSEEDSGFRQHRCPDANRYIPMWTVGKLGEVAITDPLGTPLAMVNENGEIICRNCDTFPPSSREDDSWSLVGEVLRHRCKMFAEDSYAWSIHPQSGDLIRCDKCQSVNLAYDPDLAQDLQPNELTRLVCGDCGAVVSVDWAKPIEETPAEDAPTELPSVEGDVVAAAGWAQEQGEDPESDGEPDPPEDDEEEDGEETPASVTVDEDGIPSFCGSCQEVAKGADCRFAGTCEDWIRYSAGQEGA